MNQRKPGELGLAVEYEDRKNSNRSWKKRNASKYPTNSAEMRPQGRRETCFFPPMKLTKMNVRRRNRAENLRYEMSL